MLANEFSAFEHSPLFFVDIIIHCSLLRTCRVRVKEKEEFLVYTVLWTLTCHPYLESTTALSDKEKERKVNFRTRFFLMLANEFLAFEHSPLFFVDIIIHCSLLRTCRVRVEEKEEFLVYTVLWTLTCHPYLESATALSDYYKEKERKVNFRTRFFLMLANEFSAFEHSPLFFVDIIIHCSLLRTCRVRVEEKEEFLVYTVLWTLTCHPYLKSATALSDYYKEKEQKSILDIVFFLC